MSKLKQYLRPGRTTVTIPSSILSGETITTPNIVSIQPDSLFDAREQKEIEFCTKYVSEFNHGTDGHTRMSVVAKQAARIKELEAKLNNGIPVAITEINHTSDISAAEYQGQVFREILISRTGVEITLQVTGNPNKHMINPDGTYKLVKL